MEIKMLKTRLWHRSQWWFCSLPHCPTLYHLIIAYAATGQHLPDQKAPPSPPLPTLVRLLQHMTRQQIPANQDAENEYSLSPPHEQVLAHALGLPTTDGLIPWAGWEAQQSSVPCAWFTPCHWQASMDQVMLHPIEHNTFSEHESQTLLQALAPWAKEDGIQLDWENNTRWRAEGAVFADIPWASLDRVAYRQLDAWLPSSTQHPRVRGLLRLQNEAQMLFYNHPLYDQRVRAGQTPINGFWISGAGHWPGTQNPQPPRLVTDLRRAALQGDWQGWQNSWQELEQRELLPLLQRLEAGEAVRLTLCGERRAITWNSKPAGRTGPLGRLMELFQRQPAPELAAILSAL